MITVTVTNPRHGSSFQRFYNTQAEVNNYITWLSNFMDQPAIAQHVRVEVR